MKGVREGRKSEGKEEEWENQDGAAFLVNRHLPRSPPPPPPSPALPIKLN